MLRSYVAPPPGHFLKRLYAGFIVIDILVVALAGVMLKHSHDQYRESAIVTTQNLARVLQENMASTFGQADLGLRAIMDEIASRRAAVLADTRSLQEFTDRQLARQPDLVNLWVANARGDLIVGHGIKKTKPGLIADREYFHRLRDDPGAGRVFSPPVMGRVSSEPVLIMARRLNNPDGTFAGVVGASVAINHLVKTFAAVNVGGDGRITLRDAKLAVVARYPEPRGIESSMGRTDIAPAVLNALKTGGATGTVTAISSGDAIERTFSFRKFADDEFVVIVGLARHDYLAVWKMEALQAGVLVVLFVALTTWFAYMTRGALRRQQAALAALVDQDAQLRQAKAETDATHRLLQEAVASIASGFTIYDADDRLVICNEAYLDFYRTSRDLIVPGARFADIIRRGAERGQYREATDNLDAWVEERVRRHQTAAGC